MPAKDLLPLKISLLFPRSRAHLRRSLKNHFHRLVGASAGILVAWIDHSGLTIFVTICHSGSFVAHPIPPGVCSPCVS